MSRKEVSKIALIRICRVKRELNESESALSCPKVERYVIRAVIQIRCITIHMNRNRARNALTRQTATHAEKIKGEKRNTDLCDAECTRTNIRFDKELCLRLHPAPYRSIRFRIGEQ